jgi:integrase
VSGKWSTPKRCNCKDTETGKELGRTCPKLTGRHHGTVGYDTRIPTTSGVRNLRRFGFPTKTAADAAAKEAWALVELGRDDTRTREKIGDLIFRATARGGELPDIEDVRRRLGLRRELDKSETFAEAWEAWLAGKRKAKPSYEKSLAEIGRNWLLPVLGDIALDRVGGESCSLVFSRIEDFNEEIEQACEAGRKPSLPGDVRKRAKLVGIATQHRIYAALRAFMNFQWKRAHAIPFNPVFMVELEPETREAPLTWSPEQVGQFLEHTKDDRLSFLWRLALLRGFRRGELCGMGEADADLDDACIHVCVALLALGGKLVWGKPKSKAGERIVDLDEGSATAGRAHLTRRKRERLAAGEAWEDSGCLFTTETGAPLNPDRVSLRFKELATGAGLPVIKFHAARHTAASLALEAGVDIKIVSDQLGHSTTTITRDLYQHVRRQVHRDAAERVVALLPGQATARETGS